MKKNKIDKDWFSEELNHYNKKYLEKRKKWKYDILFLKAHKAFFNMINDVIIKKESCKVLDLGCGDGSRTRYLSLNPRVSLIGIDISESGIKKANSNKIGKAIYYKMRVEDLDFKPESFDLIIDYGSFSSFKMKIVWPLINKLIKPGGSIIGIETLGENPFFKIKRTLNIKRKKRTSNLYENIITLNQLFIWSKKCSNLTYKTYGFFSLLLTPLILIFNNSLINYFIKLADKLDEIIFMKFQFFQKNSFKVLFHYKFLNDLK